MGLSYELLLDLYRGRSTAVEQITDPEQRQALAIDSPVGRMVEDIGRKDAPRHVVLTGSAGDGKTFSALTARTTSFDVITDASARRAGVDISPVEDLADQIEAALQHGRLLLAINRGQLERLYERAAARPGLVGSFITEARRRAALQDTWEPSSGSIAVADLGHLDRTATTLALLGKVVEMPVRPDLAAPTKAAFESAQTAFANPRVGEWIASVVRAATATGANVTMRQLWSFISFLATGARGPNDPTPTSIGDAVGARLFDPSAEGTLFEVARERCDPTLTPNAKLSRQILIGELLAMLNAGGVAPLLPPGEQLSGRTLAKVAVVHGVGVTQIPNQQADEFTKVVGQLKVMQPGPQALGAYTRALIRGMYKALGLWHSADALPAWQTLCFDSSRISTAAAVADSALNSTTLKLALPRPPPEVAPYLLPHWRPPFIWLAGPNRAWLRLSPRAFRGLLSNVRALEPEDLFALDSWLRRVGRPDGGAVSVGEAPFRVSRRSSGQCVVFDDGPSGRTSVSIEGLQ